MASNLALSGLASGVDTSSIVTQLMALERQATTRLGYRQNAVDAQRTALKDVAGTLSALQSAAEALAAAGTWSQAQTVESSDAARYKQQRILIAPRGQLVVMLYDGCLRFLSQAAAAMGESRHGEAFARLARAEAIVEELLETLDLERGGVIASRLQGIYVFCLWRLIEARAERDPAIVEHVAELLADLRDALAQVAAA